jgi:hypothetical protein
MDWIASLGKSVKETTIRNYLKGLRNYHIFNRFPVAPFDDPLIDYVLRGVLRTYGIAPKRERLPITSPILRRILDVFAKDRSFEALNLRAALCTAFAGFLRPGEFTWVRWDYGESPKSCLARKHVTFTRQGTVILRLPASKTDPYRQGTDIYLASTGSILCPVSALHQLFERFPAKPNDPLFSRVAGLPFSRTYVVDKIKGFLLRSGFTPSQYNGHSLRKGAAVSAIAAGATKDEVKLLGRWKSDAVDIYINEVDKSTLASRMLALNNLLLSVPPNNLSPSIPGIIADLAADHDFADDSDLDDPPGL